MMDYKRFSVEDYNNILSLINDRDRVLYGENISEDYSRDELGSVRVMPNVVVQALSSEEVSKVMKYAYDNNIPVTPRGSGTGLVGSAVPIKAGIVIDLSKINNILELDEENLTLKVEQGVLLLKIEK